MNPSLFDLFRAVNDILLAAKADWGSIHPLVIHFPIVLLLIVPLFILAGLLFPKQNKNLFGTALVLLWCGVLAIFLSVATGEIASEAVPKTSEAFSTLKLHYNLAELSRNIFAALAAVFTLYFFLLSLLEKKLKTSLHMILVLLYILAYSACLLILANTAHQGGKLVHKYGVRSTLYNFEISK